MKKIIIELGPLLNDPLYGCSMEFIVSSHLRALQELTGLEWHFLADSSLKGHQALAQVPEGNLQFSRSIPGALGRLAWYRFLLPWQAKKHQAGLMVTTSGLSANLKIPQIAWIPGFLMARGPGRVSPKKLSLTVQRSALMFAYSDHIKGLLVGLQHAAPEKIRVARSAADPAYEPLSWAEKESMKVRFAAGKEYYLLLANGPAAGYLPVLKAFSQFKKRQQSNLQLAIARQGPALGPAFEEKLETFKYRAEVHVYHNLGPAALRGLLSGAYGLLSPFPQEELGSHVLNAFKAKVPVIASGLGELLGDAALQAVGEGPASLSSQMMLLYKDELLRGRLIEKGSLQWPKYSEELGAAQLLRAIEGLLALPGAA